MLMMIDNCSMVPVTVTVAAGCQGVVWTNTVNVTATGNTIQKTGGAGSTWDAGAVSAQTIQSGDGYVEASVGSQDSALDTYRMFGLGNGRIIYAPRWWLRAVELASAKSSLFGA